jgi:cytochrome c553
MRDVKKLILSDTTPMPTDYAKRLSRAEIRDLLAYLAKQDIRGKESAQ